MNLDLVNDIFNHLKENKFVQNLINELSSYLENNLDDGSKNIPIIEEILSKNNVTTGNENSIRWNEENVIVKYAEKNRNDKPMYFVKDSKKTYWFNNQRHSNDNVYTVLKVENNKIEEMEINKKDMPKEIGVNDVFRIENGKYVIDNLATKELQEEITNMAKEIINKQNINLEKYRKEGHLYLVTEEIGNNRFLRDLTDGAKIEFEEVDIPKDLLNNLGEGAVIRYTNGRYEYYSNDGFERKKEIQ